MNIAVITGSTRDNRATRRLARWVQNELQQKDVTVDDLDLKVYDMPFLNEEPWNPERKLTEGTKSWLESLAKADGYVFVTAEHNHSIPAPLKNAIDYTAGEMNRKPAMIVAHGSVSGVRAIEQLRLILNSNIGVVPVPTGVAFQGRVTEVIGVQGELSDVAEKNTSSLQTAIDELLWYTSALSRAKS